MKCLNCGYCCIQCSVVIVKPRYVSDIINFEKEETFMFKNSDKKCPHLRIDEDTKLSSCSIHHFDWYKKTPCFSHTQMEESPEENCRMGEYMFKNEELRNKLLEKEVTYGP